MINYYTFLLLAVYRTFTFAQKASKNVISSSLPLLWYSWAEPDFRREVGIHSPNLYWELVKPETRNEEMGNGRCVAQKHSATELAVDDEEL